MSSKEIEKLQLQIKRLETNNTALIHSVDVLSSSMIMLIRNIKKTDRRATLLKPKDTSLDSLEDILENFREKLPK